MSHHRLTYSMAHSAGATITVPVSDLTVPDDTALIVWVAYRNNANAPVVRNAAFGVNGVDQTHQFKDFKQNGISFKALQAGIYTLIVVGYRPDTTEVVAFSSPTITVGNA